MKYNWSKYLDRCPRCGHSHTGSESEWDTFQSEHCIETGEEETSCPMCGYYKCAFLHTEAQGIPINFLNDTAWRKDEQLEPYGNIVFLDDTGNWKRMKRIENEEELREFINNLNFSDYAKIILHQYINNKNVSIDLRYKLRAEKIMKLKEKMNG